VIWDLVIVTARTAQQRWLFDRYLSRSLRPVPPAGEAGLAIPTGERSGVPGYIVLQDPPGPQLGTAGATVHALGVAAQHLRERFATSRVLVLHCGGLSQRVPQLSHLGKAFAPGPASNSAQGGDATLFARIVAELDHLFQEMEPGAVIACGDVLFRAPRLGIVCRSDEAVAVACRASAEQSSRHGVYLWHADQDRVAESWQKPPVARLLELGKHREWGLDTGILYLGAHVAGRVLGAVGVTRAEEAPAAFLVRKQEWQGVELYRDLTPPMTPAWQREQRLAGVPGEVQDALAGFPLRLTCPGEAALLHFGTNEELIRILSADDGPRLYASYVAGGDLGPGVVLDRCLSECPITVGAGSYVSGLSRFSRQLAIAAGRVAYQVPLRSPRASGARRLQAFVTMGVNDDAKRHPEEGATLAGEPLETWLRELGASRETVWEGIPGPQRSLWNARLFPIGEGEGVADAVPWLADLSDGQLGQRVDQWRRHPRCSPAEASRLFDARRWWAHEQRISAHCYADRLEAAVRESDGAALGELLRDPGLSDAAKKRARERLRTLGLSEPASITGARAWLVAASLSHPRRAGGAAGELGEAERRGGVVVSLRERGFQALSRALVRGQELAREEDLQWQIAPGESIEVRAPVRVDLAGGWTVTPPQACERGGAVLNLALLLDGRRPLAARVERIAEPRVELVADDLGCRRVLAPNRIGPRRPDPRDPLGIHRAALQLLGLFSGARLPERLRRLGGGLRLTTAAQVPEGSGLGTSSILGAVVLAALNRAFGRQPSPDELCRDVLRLEQLMGTGGGWQDQVGGMWGGVKFAGSAPGVDQSPQVERLSLSPEVERGLAERMVLFYTGAPRLARDLLQRVVGRYLVGDPATLAALDEMPAVAHRARTALLAGDWVALGRCLNRSWELNQQLEPTCSNLTLTALVSRIAPLVAGAKLAGAGGGGFLFALARDRDCRAQLEALLADVPPPAKLYTASLDNHHPAFDIRQGPGSPWPIL
jgi:fucokinase